jgi:hypothetical protein
VFDDAKYLPFKGKEKHLLQETDKLNGESDENEAEWKSSSKEMIEAIMD